MGYQNVKSGTLRAQRQQARRQAASAPVGQTGIGHGDGLRIYDGGKVILDGSDQKIIFQILGSGGFITYEAQDRAGLRADPAFWGNAQGFVVAGPLRDESTAGAGYGGSNLHLNATNGVLSAGQGGPTSARVVVGDDGAIQLNGLNAGAQFWADGAWSAGSTDGVLMQAGASGGLGVWPGTGGMSVNGDFSVTGAKNFLMDHPDLPDHTIRYGSTESPVSAIECRGRVTISEDGTAPVEFPEHFAAIVKPGTDVDVWLSPYGPDAAWCELPTATGATIHGTPGAVVAWTTTAERTGGDFTVVEAGSTAPAPRPQPPSPPEPQEASQWQSPDTSQAGSQT